MSERVYAMSERVYASSPGDRVVRVSLFASIPAAGIDNFGFDELVSELVGEVEHGIQNTGHSYAHLTVTDIQTHRDDVTNYEHFDCCGQGMVPSGE
jgi:hypothetical protein